MLTRRAFAATALAAPFVLSAAVRADAPFRLRASLDTTPAHGRTISIADYLKKLEAASGGRIATQLFDSGQLFADRDVIKALVQGQAEPQAARISHTPDPTVTTGPPLADTGLTVTGAAAVASAGEGTELRVPVAGGGTAVLQINRVLQPGDGHGAGAGVSATWEQPDGTQARGVFVTARYETHVA